MDGCYILKCRDCRCITYVPATPEQKVRIDNRQASGETIKKILNLTDEEETLFLTHRCVSCSSTDARTSSSADID